MTDLRGTKILVGKPSEVFGLGRPCAMPGCRTPLSRYNPGVFCSAHEPRPKPVLYDSDEDLKVCRRCHEALPATTAHFRERERGLSSNCKGCLKEQAIEARKRAQEGKNNDAGSKRCPRCRKKKPRTTDYWRVSKGHHDGLSQYCGDCINAAWREAGARSRKKKAQAVTYESPSGIKRGVVEQ